MTDWSKHVHRFAKKHNMSYKQANRSRKCKETYKKRKTSPRRKSPRRKSPRRMNPPDLIDEEDDLDKVKTEDFEKYLKELKKRGRAKYRESELGRPENNEGRYTAPDLDTMKQYLKAEGLTESQAQNIISTLERHRREMEDDF